MGGEQCGIWLLELHPTSLYVSTETSTLGWGGGQLKARAVPWAVDNSTQQNSCECKRHWHPRRRDR